MDANSISSGREPTVNVALRGARVTQSFRDNLFDAANRAGMTPNEFVLQATAESLVASGRSISGLFHPGDVSALLYGKRG
jgi:hypothetical protein